MKYLFSQRVLLEVKPQIKIDGLITLDFDGTLAPIVEQRDAAEMPVAMADELDRLCELTTVAILSGRALNDLRQLVPSNVAYLIGDHGNEGLATITKDILASHEVCEGWVIQLKQFIEDQDIQIEKKNHTLSVHFRMTKNRTAAKKYLLKVFDKLTPSPSVVGGNCVFNLFPSDAMRKDNAVDALVRLTHAHKVLYIGDDECDDLVFASAKPDWITIRVGYCRESKAKYYLRQQSEVLELLQLLNHELASQAPTSG